MKRFRKIMLALGIVFIAIQFIQPVRNKSGLVLLTDISTTINIPENVLAMLKNACYDCHSNNTNYPWYVNMQPIGWMMARHIKNGKEKLNFSEFGSYSIRRRLSKLKGIADQIKDNDMPLFSYRIMHKNARLSPAEKTLIVEWTQKATNRISANN